jgi:hypothetical protein
MAFKEVEARRNNRPSVCGLYLHFFLSLLALMECSLRLLIHFFMLLVMGLLYYIVYCVSCGEWVTYSNACVAHHSSMYGLYSGLLCGIIGNLGKSSSLLPCYLESVDIDIELCIIGVYHIRTVSGRATVCIFFDHHTAVRYVTFYHYLYVILMV